VESHRGVGGEFVHGGRGTLGQQEEHRAQGRQHQIARQRGEHGAARQVPGEHQQRVTAVLAAAARGSRGVAPVPRRGLDVVDNGAGDNPDPVTGGLDPPAEVGVLPEQAQARVEAADLVPHVAAGEHPGAAHRDHVAVAVVLPLVDLTGLDAGDPPPGAVDGGAGFEQDVPVRPVHDLRAEHRRLRCLTRPGEQPLQRIRSRLAVIVQQPDPLRAVVTRRARQRHVGVRGPVAQGLGDGDAVPRGAVHAEHGRTAERLGQHRAAAVGTARVNGHHALHRPGLLRERVHDTRQPRGSVVGDDHRGNNVWAVRAVW